MTEPKMIPTVHDSDYTGLALAAPAGILEKSDTSGRAKPSHAIPDTSGIRALIEAAFPDAPVMLAIAEAESHMRPEAANPVSSARGLFQILIGTWNAYGCSGDRLDASDNIACARRIYDAEGTRPWNASAHAW